MKKLIYTNEDGIKFYYDSANNELMPIKSDSLLVESLGTRKSFPKMLNKENYTLNMKNTRQQLILSVTEDCNLRCTYCIYHDDRYNDKDWSCNTHMSFDTAKKAIDNFLSNSKLTENRFISFYGGEPLVNFSLIEKCIHYVKETCGVRNINFSMTTNGLFLKGKILSFLIDNNVFLNVSIDGAKDVHDRYRVDINNRPSFDVIIKNLIFIKKNHKSYFKTNVTFTSVVAPPVKKDGFLDFLELLQQEVTLTDIDITDYMKDYMEENNVPMITTMDEKIEINRFPKLLQQIQIERISDVLEVLKQGKNNVYIPGGYCRPFIKKTFVATDGKYYMCEKFDQKETNAYGDVEEDININKIMALNGKINEFMNEHCTRCWANRFCNICYVNLVSSPAEKCKQIQNESKELLKLIIKENIFIKDE